MDGLGRDPVVVVQHQRERRLVHLDGASRHADCRRLFRAARERRSALLNAVNSRIRHTLELQTILDKHTDPWGIKVQLVETKHVDLPETMVRAIAKQAEAERERRAKVIHADGEFQAAEKLAQAANVSQSSLCPSASS